ncbi:MAG: class I SAM-dependent methyltransferase [Solirubrobacteraceae bacterium]
MSGTPSGGAASRAPAPSTALDRCRVCGNEQLEPVIDLGDQYLSSIFPDSLDYRSEVPRSRLDLALCVKREETCGLLQLARRHDITAMYAAYPYTSSTNTSMRRILGEVAQAGRAAADLRPGDLVLDIGGNDGTLLSFLGDDDLDLLTIDPARNVEPVFASDRYRQVREFFSAQSFREAADRKARLVFSVAMYYHLDDPLSFTHDVSAVLDDDGVWVIQMAYLPAMLETNMYDNVVHEHAGYYAARHMQWIMERAGLEVFDVTLNDVYGGSFRTFVKRAGNPRFPATERLAALLQSEDELGLFETDLYTSFQRRIERTREELVALCREIVDRGETIWVYGASTKGNTILQFCGLGSKELAAAADANPFKIGKYIVGSDVRIGDEDEMRAARPDWLLALPYSFVDAFIERERDLVAGGTRFIVPLPEVRTLP